jgi:hypothetical protein
MDRSIIEQVFYGQRRSVPDNPRMTGDEEEFVQVHENGMNVVRGKVFGTVVQLESLDGDLVFPAPKVAGD